MVVFMLSVSQEISYSLLSGLTFDQRESMQNRGDIQCDVKSFVDLSVEELVLLVSDSPTGIWTKDCSERWRRPHALRQASLFICDRWW